MRCGVTQYHDVCGVERFGTMNSISTMQFLAVFNLSYLITDSFGALSAFCFRQTVGSGWEVSEAKRKRLGIGFTLNEEHVNQFPTPRDHSTAMNLAPGLYRWYRSAYPHLSKETVRNHTRTNCNIYIDLQNFSGHLLFVSSSAGVFLGRANEYSFMECSHQGRRRFCFY